MSSIADISDLALVLEVFLLIASMGTVATYIIIVVANRADPDPTGKRPMAVYLFAGAFVTLWVSFIGAITVVTSLVSLIGPHITPPYESSSEIHPFGDAAVRGVTVGLFLLLTVGVAHHLHRSRGLALAASEDDPASPTRRVARSYVAAVSFVGVIIFVLSTFALLFTFAGLVAPGIYDIGSRVTDTRFLIVEVWVMFLAAMIFRSHQALAPTQLRLFQRRPATIVEVIEFESEA